MWNQFWPHTPSWTFKYRRSWMETHQKWDQEPPRLNGSEDPSVRKKKIIMEGKLGEEDSLLSQTSQMKTHKNECLRQFLK